MAGDLKIRVAQPKDATRIDALLQACYPPLMAGSYKAGLLARVLPLMTRSNPALLCSGSYYLAEMVSGEVTGCGGWSFGQPGSGDLVQGLAHIRHFATHPDWTRRGIGRALFERSARDAKAAGISRLQAYSSLNAEAFYRAVGFKTLRPVEVELLPGLMLPAVLMECALS
jgi:N-acetylglutamate synthase-like GNAT family acetyltransferase